MESIILMTMLAANQPQIISWEGTQNCPMSQPVQAHVCSMEIEMGCMIAVQEMDGYGCTVDIPATKMI